MYSVCSDLDFKGEILSLHKTYISAYLWQLKNTCKYTSYVEFNFIEKAIMISNSLLGRKTDFFDDYYGNGSGTYIVNMK